MRVTSETKAATRQAILDAARGLFADNDFDATTTRDIARAAGIASGTLFNYFPTKEAVLACLANEAVSEAAAAFDRHPDPQPDAPRHTSAPQHHPTRTLEEDLFALAAASLRRLKPFRRHLPVLLETALSPVASAPQTGASSPGDAQSLRTRHLEAVVSIAMRHGHPDISPVALQLYWTLYTGVLAFWANDPSPAQEDTLALTDESANMFAAWLRQQSQPAGATGEAGSIPASPDKEPPCPPSPS